MPVAYQSRAVTEPQREMARRSRDGGIVYTNYALVSSRLPCGTQFVIAFGVAKIMQGAKPVRLAAGALLFYEEK